MTIEELKEKAASRDIALNNEMCEQLSQYADLLIEWNQKMNLTAITEKGEIVEKHFYDCIVPLSDAEFHGSCADIGSGAGFPGLVWKIVRPDLSVTLVEPTGKRCTFLNEVIAQLKLKNVTVINRRAEEYAADRREAFDIVSARAVASLPILCELCLPLVKVNGMFVAMKGRKGKEEEKEALNAVKKLGAVLDKEAEENLPDGDSRVVLYYHKAEHTPSRYPRNYGQIKKKPL